MLVQEHLKNKEQYLWSGDRAEKIYDVLRHIQLQYVKIQKNEDILSIMSNLKPNCCLKVDFPKWTNTQEAKV